MTIAILCAFIVPLTVAAGIAASGLLYGRAGRRLRIGLTRVAPLTTIPALIAAVIGGDGRDVDRGWFLLGDGSLYLDSTARAMTALAAALYAVALVLIADGTIERAPTLCAALLVCFAGNIGVFMAADVVTFYLSFTVMSFVGYLLVIHDRTDPARRAGRIYLVMTVIGEAAVLVAMILIAFDGGYLVADAPAAIAESDHRNLIIAMLLIGFGVKAGTVPLHVWLPLAHPSAPTPASAALSGVMIAAGIVGWLRFLPLGEIVLPNWSTAFVTVALAGAFLAVPVGLLQDNPKVILAYSSISQMGFVAVLIGVALNHPHLAAACTIAAIVYTVHHGAAKGALFLGIALWKSLGGGRYRYVVAAGWVLAALAVAGAPLTSGYIAKYAAKQATGEATFAGIEIATILPWVGLGSTVLLIRAAIVLATRTTTEARRPGVPLWTWWALILAGFGYTYWLANARDDRIVVPSLWSASTWFDQSWPILLGLAAAAIAMRLSRREEIPDWIAHPHGDTVPPGDVVVLEERWARSIGRRVTTISDGLADRYAAATATAARLPGIGNPTTRIQDALGSRTGSGLLVLTLCVVTIGVALVVVW